jgi:hexosaminidase
LKSHEELLRYFIVSVNELVKKQGRKTIVWEGFRREGKLEIPREILVMPFEGGKYYRPDHLVEDGYTLINTSWQPLYVVSHRSAPIGQWPPEHIYKWNMFRWEHFRQWAPAYNPIQLPETAHVIGAQMCAWEQPEEVEIPSLRQRLPAMSERLWSYPASGEFSDFAARLSITDASLTRLLGTVLTE